MAMEHSITSMLIHSSIMIRIIGAGNGRSVGDGVLGVHGMVRSGDGIIRIIG